MAGRPGLGGGGGHLERGKLLACEPAVREHAPHTTLEVTECGWL